MNRSTFYYRLKLYGIHPADFRHGMSEGSGGGQLSAAALEPLLSLNHEELEALAALARQLCRNRNGV